MIWDAYVSYVERKEYWIIKIGSKYRKGYYRGCYIEARIVNHYVMLFSNAKVYLKETLIIKINEEIKAFSALLVLDPDKRNIPFWLIPSVVRVVEKREHLEAWWRLPFRNYVTFNKIGSREIR